MSGGGYDDEGRWVWNCSCDPGPEGQHQGYCARNDPPVEYTDADRAYDRQAFALDYGLREETP